MTAEEIQMFMGECGASPFNGSLTPDREYMHPTKGWILGDFANALRVLLSELEQTTYRIQSNDCDDFARLAAWFAQMLHNRTAPTSEAALAFGEFYYVQDISRKGHAINCAIVMDDGKPSLIFFEPQSQEQVYLSEREIGTCEYFHF